MGKYIIQTESLDKIAEEVPSEKYTAFVEVLLEAFDNNLVEYEE